jgi:NAD(P)-dependent dehydrogenase (short-subunit alcohol dehydrogenase family)
MPTAIVTGGSKGLGRALTAALVDRGWTVVVDARHADQLRAAAAALGGPAGTSVIAVPGDVADAGHRRDLLAAAEQAGGLDLLVNNASTLGASPLPRLDDIGDDVLTRVFTVNVVAPLALTRDALPQLRRSGSPVVLHVTSDAAAEAYEGWGGYGASKAALEHAGAVLAAEEPALRVLVVDPGDLRTEMHQDAFPGEDISDRPRPEAVVPALVALIEGDRPSGRYRAAELAEATGAPA